MRGITREEALETMALEGIELEGLLQRASAVRNAVFGDSVRLCAITNAKSGRCPERCDFCVQSARFETDAPEYPLKDADTIVEEAIRARRAGAREFSIVTSGPAMRSPRELTVVAEAVRRIAEEVGIEACASLGNLSKDALVQLRDAGLVRYHHNIEAAPSFHPQVVHTHSWEEEAWVVRDARAVGLKVCCGGILGMGESREQRVEMAFALAELDPDCVPLNFLDARAGTPLEGRDDLTPLECLKIIAVFRLVMPRTQIFVCGGRERNLGGLQARIFDAGATGTMVGDYLTTRGQAAEEDRRMIAGAGYRIEGPPEKASVEPGDGARR